MENMESGNENGNGNSEKVVRRTYNYVTPRVYILLVTPSSLDSTICHSSCLNCVLHIFDKAAQDQMIGVTGHDFNVIKFSSVLYLFLHTKHYIRNNIMIILHLLNAPLFCIWKESGDKPNFESSRMYRVRHWTREQDDHPHFWPLPAMAIITNFIETMKILCGQLQARPWISLHPQ